MHRLKLEPRGNDSPAHAILACQHNIYAVVLWTFSRCQLPLLLGNCILNYSSSAQLHRLHAGRQIEQIAALAVAKATVLA